MSITGKGTVATGRIERGIAKTGDTIEIVGVKEIVLVAIIVGGVLDELKALNKLSVQAISFIQFLGLRNSFNSFSGLKVPENHLIGQGKFLQLSSPEKPFGSGFRSGWHRRTWLDVALTRAVLGFRLKQFDSIYVFEVLD